MGILLTILIMFIISIVTFVFSSVKKNKTLRLISLAIFLVALISFIFFFIAFGGFR